jgi:hypothetical protein
MKERLKLRKIQRLKNERKLKVGGIQNRGIE